MAAPTAPRRRHRALRVLGAALVLLALLSLGALLALDSQPLRRRIGAAIESRTGLAFDCSAIRWAPPLGIALQDATLRAPDAPTDAPPLLRARRILLRPRWRSALGSGPLVIEQAVVQGPDLAVHRSADGRWNLPGGARVAALPPPRPPAAQPPRPAAKKGGAAPAAPLAAPDEDVAGAARKSPAIAPLPPPAGPAPRGARRGIRLRALRIEGGAARAEIAGLPAPLADLLRAAGIALDWGPEGGFLRASGLQAAGIGLLGDAGGWEAKIERTRGDAVALRLPETPLWGGAWGGAAEGRPGPGGLPAARGMGALRRIDLAALRAAAPPEMARWLPGAGWAAGKVEFTGVARAAGSLRGRLQVVGGGVPLGSIPAYAEALRRLPSDLAAGLSARDMHARCDFAGGRIILHDSMLRLGPDIHLRAVGIAGMNGRAEVIVRAYIAEGLAAFLQRALERDGAHAAPWAPLPPTQWRWRDIRIVRDGEGLRGDFLRAGEMIAPQEAMKTLQAIAKRPRSPAGR